MTERWEGGTTRRKLIIVLCSSAGSHLLPACRLSIKEWRTVSACHMLLLPKSRRSSNHGQNALKLGTKRNFPSNQESDHSGATYLKQGGTTMSSHFTYSKLKMTQLTLDRTGKRGAGQMVQQLKTLAALPENLGSIPNNHLAVHNYL